jgi:hypothetical protein
LDRFEVRNNKLEMIDGTGMVPSALRVQWSIFDNRTSEHHFIPNATSLELPAVTEPAEYLMAEISAAKGPAVWIYVRPANGRAPVVGVERHFPSVTRK